MRFVPFFAMLLFVLGGANVYVHRRASWLLRLGPGARRALGVLLVLGLVVMVGGRLLRGVIPDAAVVPLTITGNTLELAVLIAALLLLLVDLGHAVARLASWGIARARRRDGASPPARASAEPEPQPEPQPLAHGALGAARSTSAQPEPLRGGHTAAAALPAQPEPVQPALPRRSFLRQAAMGSALAVGGGTALYGASIGRRDYQIETVVVPIAGLSPALDGFTIVQLSDLHLGVFIGDRERQAAEDRVRGLAPDLIVLTGDLVDHDARFAEDLGRFVRRLGPLARHGVAAIPGNHDHYTGLDLVVDALQRGGAEVLLNRGLVIGGEAPAGAGRTPGLGFALLGVDDVYARTTGRAGPDLDAAIAMVPRHLPRVLLAHNPVFFPEAAGKVALQLSGHTHGGQVNLIVRPADLLLPYGYVAGLYRRGESRLYVNRGFGTAGPPVRVGAPPEVTRVVLVAA